MRHFTKFEKEVMNYITSFDVLSEDIAISNILTKFCHCSFQWEKNSITIYFNKNKYSYSNILNYVLSIIGLFDYLEAHSLIYVFERTNISERHELINKQESHAKSDDNRIQEEKEIAIGKGVKVTVDGKEYLFDDTATGISPLSKVVVPWDIAKYLDKYAKSVLFCTETLRHIKNQDYKDDATIQYESSRKQTWFAIWTSIIIGLMGIFSQTIISIPCCLFACLWNVVRIIFQLFTTIISGIFFS